MVKNFDAWTTRELEGLNSALSGKQIEPVTLLAREEWEKGAGQK